MTSKLDLPQFDTAPATRWAAALLLLAACAAPGDPGASGDVEERAQELSAATVWTQPTLLKYRSVVRAVEEDTDRTVTVFIELPGGAAASIVASSVRLNGFAPLPEPHKLGDKNGNGVVDLKVKFDRAVFDGNVEGVFEVTGQTASGPFTVGGTIDICDVVGIERSTYTLPYTTSNMPDSQLDGLPAEIEVRRVRPIFGAPSRRACDGAVSLVLVHGRTIEVTVNFDLSYKDYNIMEALAQRGIESYAVNLLGFGRSRLVDETASTNPLGSACNASLPTCPAPPPGQACVPGPLCDCQGVPPSIDQQGSTSYLTPNPLASRCPHTSSFPFQNIGNQVADLDRVVDDVRAKTGGQVSLLGYSAGGITAGVYLSDPIRQAKIERAMFVSSLFNVADTPPPFPAWPMGLTNYANMAGGFNLDPTLCPGQRDDGIVDAVWAGLKAREPLDAPWLVWGPSPTTPTGGVNRFPIVSRSGWNAAAAQRISTPILAMNGNRDNVVPGGASAASMGIVRSSPQANACTTSADCATGYVCETAFTPAVCRLDNRRFVELPCASHSLLWETCSGAGCLDPHKQLMKLVGDFVLTGMVFANP